MARLIYWQTLWKANRKRPVDVIEKLINKTKYVDWKNNSRHEYFCIISKNGLTKNAKQFAKENGVLSFDMRDMKRVFIVGNSED